MPSIRPFLLATLLALPLLADAQADYVPLEQRLTPEQMRTTGIDQLTTTQLDALNALLREQRTSEVDAAHVQGRAAATEASRQEPIASHIVGPFRGWSGNTRFTLANGQSWQVTDTPAHYMPASQTMASPAVVISPGKLGGFRMEVDGLPVRAKVRQIR